MTTITINRDVFAQHIQGLIEVMRMPNSEHVADAHNKAVRFLHAALAAKPEQDRAQRGEPVLWRYRDSEQVIRAMDGYTPVEGWTPLYTATQPAHTEAEVQEILDSSLREWSVFEQTVRIILNVEKP